MKLYLIDISGYIYRAYWAIRGKRDNPGMTNHRGQHVEALYGFTKMSLALTRRLEREGGMPDLIAAVFDPPGGRGSSFRRAIYPEYKTNRTPEPDIYPQFDMIRAITPLLGLPMVEVDGFEADDVIATLAEQAKRDGLETVIVSADKDLMQLVDEPLVVMADPVNDMKRIGRAEVIAKFGVPPEQVVDVQALLGDATDNVPGVQGIGAKTAPGLIQQWGCIETMYSRVENFSKGVREKLIAGQELAVISKRLVTLRRDLPMPVGLPDLVYGGLQPGLEAFLRDHDFKSILRDLGYGP